MTDLHPIIHHYEDLPLVEHYKIWIGVNRVQSEYIRILRLPLKGQIPKKYVTMMKDEDNKVHQRYIDSLSEKVQDDGLDKLYIENEKMAVQLANEALKLLQKKMSDAIAMGSDVKISEAVVILKTIEQYATFNRKQTTGQDTQSSLAKLLLGHNTQDSQHTLHIQHQVQRSGSLRLPSSSL
jgi:hypothetical protein